MNLLLAPILVLLNLISTTVGSNFNTTTMSPIDDGQDAVMIWGGVKVEGNKIINVKQADFTAALEKPITVSVNGKEAKMESASINIYPYSGDPVLIYLVGDTFTKENIAEMQAKIGWGSKVFFESVVVNIKGKSKSIPDAFNLKLI